METMRGWIKLHRELTEWEWYGDHAVSRLFIHLLLTANHADKSWRGTAIARGQKLTSRAKLAQETGLSEKQIRTALKKLEKTGELAINATKKETVLTVCKYDCYQSTNTDKGQASGLPMGQLGANRGPSNEQEPKSSLEDKEAIYSPEPSKMPSEQDDPVFISIPLIGKAQYDVRESEVMDRQETYPAVNVRQELRNIRQWNIDNNKKRKTRKGIGKHISNWLGVKQDKGGTPYFNGSEGTEQQLPQSGIPEEPKGDWRGYLETTYGTAARDRKWSTVDSITQKECIGKCL